MIGTWSPQSRRSVQRERIMETNERPLVCSLLPNWNGREHLEYALPSVLGTEYPNYELVVIDDASTAGLGRH